MTGPKSMHDAFAFSEQVVGNNAAVAPPPDGFRAHDWAAMPAAKLLQFRQAFGERLRRIGPKAVFVRRSYTLSGSIEPVSAVCQRGSLWKSKPAAWAGGLGLGSGLRRRLGVQNPRERCSQSVNETLTKLGAFYQSW